MLVDEAIGELKSRIDDTAIIACSGGIDSTVAAVLAHKAVGSLLHCVYVDTGLMRKGETSEVSEMFSEMGIKLQVVDASARFFESLSGVTDPEEKRKIIGEQFIRVFEEEKGTCAAKFLVQGTIAPDWIESGGGDRDVIKSHHNGGGAPRGRRHDNRRATKGVLQRRGQGDCEIPRYKIQREATIPRPGPSRQSTWRSHSRTCRFMQGSMPHSGESHQRVSGQGGMRFAMAVLRDTAAGQECRSPWGRKGPR